MAKQKSSRPKHSEIPDAVDELLRKSQSVSPGIPREALDRLTPPENTGAFPLWRRAAEAEERFDRATEDLDREKAALQVDREKLGSERQSLMLRQEEIQKNQGNLSIREKELSEIEVDLAAREKAIVQREAEADAGFVDRQRDVLAQVSESLARFRGQIRSLIDDLLASQIEFLGQIKSLADQALTVQNETLTSFSDLLEQSKSASERSLTEALQQLQELSDEHHQLLEERLTIEKMRHGLDVKQRELEVREEILQEDREALEGAAERISADIVSRLENERSVFQNRLTAAQELIEDLGRQLANRENAERRLGNRRPEEVLSELRELRSERERLTNELARRPSEANAENLRVLNSQRESWEAERIDLQRQVQELKGRLGRHQIGAVELETLRDQKRALETSNQRLRQTLDELRTDIERGLEASTGRAPFPSCQAMDKNPELQGTLDGDRVGDLRTFVDSLQHRIAYAFPETMLYYSMEDLRSLVAGFSMSYLTIMQGLSGTGKTSLPMAFARAVGGEYEVIEVQAGWRDRHDLIGHYNAFEGRFYESPFLQALYRAQCPANRDRLFVIVMDEMNLSYPEQYFADVLSAMEKPVSVERTINLMTMDAPENQTPQLLRENGREIWIPDNVWFVGTANQDETTKDFADKTYDRAHVIELPTNYPVFNPKEPQGASPSISIADLRRVFEKARKDAEQNADKGFAFLSTRMDKGATSLRDVLVNQFGIGWGNRLERQFRGYVPVVLAAGGTLGEAVDYLLASKILRKIRNRYEIRRDDLELLERELTKSWLILQDPSYAEGRPAKSLAIIQGELRHPRFDARKD